MNLLKALFFLIPLLLLFGCYDRIELEQQSYVMAIGIDTTDQENQYLFTFEIANPEVGSATAQGGEGEPPAEIVSVIGTDILTATYTANSVVAKKITLDHTKIIVASEEIARSDKFLSVIQSASRSPQIRRAVELVVSKEPAEDFIRNNEPTMEKRPHKFYNFMLSRAAQTGIIPQATLHRFFQITEGDADVFLAVYATTEQSKEKERGYEDNYIAGEIPQIGGSPTQFMGSAVFKEGKMIDILNGEETRFAHILDKTHDMDTFLATIPDPLQPEYRVSYNYAQKNKPQINIDYQKGKTAKIKVDVEYQVEIIGIQSLINYSQIQKYRKILKENITNRLEEKAKQLVKKSQEQYSTDPFYWSLYVRKHFKDVPSYEEADWNKNIYPNAEVEITFKLDKLEFGKMFDDSNVSEVRD
ncbi:Ger(x)C family spore germination protein [Gracilibacillus sp. YIM 98692]|uniref:Ger(x)C family spore germination protein n=1 Tax=Gracilibacillus sp. YIM 98692 TaxID=2663532 RepID=UPI0013D8BCF5|nr:Ger(x)C family spore germination protein [Gracilibacillus sp. YIM 98692]